MAAAPQPDEFFEVVAHHLPPEQPPGPTGGRPRVGHRAAVRVIGFVRATGCRWEDVPLELGCSGRTAHRRLRAWEGCGVWDRVHADLPRRLRAAGTPDLSRAVIDGGACRPSAGARPPAPARRSGANPGRSTRPR